MLDPYFVVEGTSGNAVELSEDPLNPGELLLTADAGTKVRVRLDEPRAARLGAALYRWYARPETHDAPVDSITQYRDGQAYSFTTPTEV